MGELEGRVAIVTGAGRGIGEHAARKLSAAGAHVLVSDIDGEAARAAADALDGPSAVHVGDLTATGEPDRAVSGGLQGGMLT